MRCLNPPFPGLCAAQADVPAQARVAGWGRRLPSLRPDPHLVSTALRSDQGPKHSNHKHESP